MKSKILVCINNSESSNKALEFATIQAEKLNFDLKIVHVMEIENDAGLLGIAEKMKSEKEQEANEIIAAAKQFVTSVSSKIEPETLIDYAEVVSEKILEVIYNDSLVQMIIIGFASNKQSRSMKLIANILESLSGKYFVPIVIIPDNLTGHQLRELVGGGKK